MHAWNTTLHLFFFFFCWRTNHNDLLVIMTSMFPVLPTAAADFIFICVTGVEQDVTEVGSCSPVISEIHFASCKQAEQQLSQEMYCHKQCYAVYRVCSVYMYYFTRPG